MKRESGRKNPFLDGNDGCVGDSVERKSCNAGMFHTLRNIAL